LGDIFLGIHGEVLEFYNEIQCYGENPNLAKGLLYMKPETASYFFALFRDKVAGSPPGAAAEAAAGVWASRAGLRPPGYRVAWCG